MASILTGNILTNYVMQGSGFPLLLIHGALMDNHLWDTQIRVFAEKYMVIAYDLRGHGESRREGDPEYSVKLAGHDLLDMLDNL